MSLLGAPIVTFEEFEADRPGGRIVATSGGFDPIHPGHISSIQESARPWDVCQTLGIEVISGVGEDKRWSSSWFLDDWSRHTGQGPATP